MKAVIYSAYGATPVLTEMPAPACPADGVVIMVGATGVCRSDWHAWKGHDPVTLPHVGGHEFAGVVAAAGDTVTVTAGSVGRYWAPEYARMLSIYSPNPRGLPSEALGYRPLR